MRFGLIVFAGFVSAVLVGCGDTDDFNPVGKKRDAASELQDIPCDGSNEGLRVIVGSNKDIYVCEYDWDESEYVWVGEGVESSGSTKSSSSSSNRYSSNYSSSSSIKHENYETNDFGISAKDDIFNTNIRYGKMIDPRDGKSYRTVDINGKTWMAENLNFTDSTIYPAMQKQNHCFDDVERYCELMGRLYTWSAAMGICPDGWHIPTSDEAEELMEAAEGSLRNLQSARGWGEGSDYGQNTLGMSFVGAGNYPAVDYPTLGYYAKMWINSGTSSNVYLLFRGPENEVLIYSFGGTVYGSVRCIADY
ncbi:FISUMP domain-containing protein [Fibrobacter sp. UBA4309]|uniref:FISUMP domain-containing protein n=1 Tax=Fibrobacter sp. UBA4309 TaxID=1946537 RepID=UPI0025C5ECA6|nr:FISUMP domain-containing protein [Fibrobacter sp. UBA4309]